MRPENVSDKCGAIRQENSNQHPLPINVGIGELIDVVNHGKANENHGSHLNGMLLNDDFIGLDIGYVMCFIAIDSSDPWFFPIGGYIMYIMIYTSLYF